MKQLITLILLISFSLHATERVYGQDAEVQQKIIQVLKLAALIKQVEQGYEIVRQGLNFIGEIKDGDFNLHSLFFNSLSIVSPAVKNDAKVAVIILLQLQIVSDFAKISSTLSQGQFSPDELKYINAVFQNLLNLLSKDTGELTTVLSDGSLQMNDGERIHKIDALYETVLEKYQFFYHFSNQVKLQNSQRTKSATELQNLLKLF